MPQNKSDREKYDTAWKFIIEHLIQPFLEFFFPDVSKIIDFGIKIELYSKELKPIESDSKTIDRLVDELFKVHTLDGEVKWILIHIEVQNYADKNFPKRMFTYYYRIFDKFDMDVISLAVLTDTDEKFRPTKYERKFCETGITFDFKIAKLLDYSEEELLKNDNPFALVALAHIEAMKAGKDENKQFDIKKRIIQLLMKRDYDKETIRNIFIFLDYILRLTEAKERKLEEEIGGKTMELMTSWEERGIEKGMERGRMEGKKETVINMLQKNMDINLIAEITGLTKKQVTDIKNGKTPTKVKI